GPPPASRRLRRWQAPLAPVQPNAVVTAGIQLARAPRLAMGGRFAEARAEIERAHAVADALGWPLGMGLSDAHRSAMTELLAGDPVAAEAHARAGYIRMERIGEQSKRSTTAVNLAEALLWQGKH